MMQRKTGPWAGQAAHGGTRILIRSAKPITSITIFNRAVQRASQSSHHKIQLQSHHRLWHTRRWLNDFAPRDPNPQYASNPRQSRFRKILTLTFITLTTLSVLAATSVYFADGEIYANLILRYKMPKIASDIDQRLRSWHQERGQTRDEHAIVMERMIVLTHDLHGFTQMRGNFPLPRSKAIQTADGDEHYVAERDKNIFVLYPLPSEDIHPGWQSIHLVVNDDGIDGTGPDLEAGHGSWRWTFFRMGFIIPNEKLSDILRPAQKLFYALCERGDLRRDKPCLICILTSDHKRFIAMSISDFYVDDDTIALGKVEVERLM
ncbi:hypothetical protein GGR57DRAFT_475449 [Xylariaceae sp. FL1272]|nr:hypothetical protein GGR57DRAFT_475449 [Xylariaceae sp. FL1272]